MDVTIESNEINNNSNCYTNINQSLNNLIYCSQNHYIKISGENRGIYISGNGSGLIKCTCSQCDKLNIEGVLDEEIFLNGLNSRYLNPLIIYKNDKWISEKAIPWQVV